MKFKGTEQATSVTNRERVNVSRMPGKKCSGIPGMNTSHFRDIFEYEGYYIAYQHQGRRYGWIYYAVHLIGPDLSNICHVLDMWNPGVEESRNYWFGVDPTHGRYIRVFSEEDSFVYFIDEKRLYDVEQMKRKGVEQRILDESLILKEYPVDHSQRDASQIRYMHLVTGEELYPDNDIQNVEDGINGCFIGYAVNVNHEISESWILDAHMRKLVGPFHEMWTITDWNVACYAAWDIDGRDKTPFLLNRFFEKIPLARCDGFGSESEWIDVEMDMENTSLQYARYRYYPDENRLEEFYESEEERRKLPKWIFPNAEMLKRKGGRRTLSRMPGIKLPVDETHENTQPKSVFEFEGCQVQLTKTRTESDHLTVKLIDPEGNEIECIEAAFEHNMSGHPLFWFAQDPTCGPYITLCHGDRYRLYLIRTKTLVRPENTNRDWTFVQTLHETLFFHFIQKDSESGVVRHMLKHAVTSKEIKPNGKYVSIANGMNGTILAADLIDIADQSGITTMCKRWWILDQKLKVLDGAYLDLKTHIRGTEECYSAQDRISECGKASMVSGQQLHLMNRYLEKKSVSGIADIVPLGNGFIVTIPESEEEDVIKKYKYEPDLNVFRKIDEEAIRAAKHEERGISG